MQKDYYKALAIKRDASEEQIKRAYHALARKYHPDLNPGDEQAESRLKEINEAYAVLADPEKRKEYDSAHPGRRNASRTAHRSSSSPRPYPHRPPPGAIIRKSVRRESQPGSPPGIIAGLDVNISGLSAGLAIARELISGLDELLSSTERAAREQQSSPRRKPEAEESGAE